MYLIIELQSVFHTKPVDMERSTTVLYLQPAIPVIQRLLLYCKQLQKVYLRLDNVI